MATFNAFPLVSAGPNGSVDLASRANEIFITPRFNVAWFTYLMTANEVAGDIIRLWFAPAGTIIIPHLSMLMSDGIATTATANVGDEDATPVAARYCAGANVAANHARVLFSATGNPAGADVPYMLTQDSWIEIVLATLATPVAGKHLQALVAYNGA